MRQAIHTKYLGPTNLKGARIKATCDAGSKSYDWNHSIGIAENHYEAAQALTEKLKWDYDLIGGSLGNEFVFILTERPKK